MLACTFVHNKFPHRAPDGKGLLRCFLGGAKDEAALELSDGEVEKIVRQELKSILRLDAEPRFIRIYRWRRAMAQYSVGHLDRVARIEAAAQTLAGLCHRRKLLPRHRRARLHSQRTASCCLRGKAATRAAAGRPERAVATPQ